MKIENVPFAKIDWQKLPATTNPGASGTITSRIQQLGSIRVRMVEYSPGYLADHWCLKGHLLLVLEGKLTTELQDGRTFELTAGQSYQVEDDTTPHRSQTDTGARLFIVD